MKDDSNEAVTRGEFRKEIGSLNQKMESRMEGMEGRMEGMESRMEGMESRMWKLEYRVRRIDDRIGKLAGDVICYVDTRIADLEDKMYTKEDHMKLMTHMDRAFKELEDSRDERILHEHQYLRMYDKVADHEKRIQILEKA